MFVTQVEPTDVSCSDNQDRDRTGDTNKTEEEYPQNYSNITELLKRRMIQGIKYERVNERRM